MSAALTEGQKNLLLDKNLAHLATLNHDGSPQVSPVWIDFDGKHVLINTEMKRQKPRNLRRDPRVAVTVIDSENAFRYVEIRGRVVEETIEGAFEHIDMLGKKYLGLDKYPNNAPGDQRVIFKIKPEHVYAQAVD
ncbi:MAG: TIGR03618 family F420-dependent PPOX class oxidoreductase [Dehalococcoidia bacterium]|nr:TIGR03618 family F420-dependent PPOX class oxidoreductase [Dehalococcoidia bacterium]